MNALIEIDDLTYVATTGGLIIYDPLNESITNLNRGNSRIPSNNILDVLMDKDNRLWLMTDIGLCAYQDQNWEEYLDLIGLITLDEKGLINVASKTTYYYWEDTDFDSLSTYPELEFSEPYDVTIDKTNGEIWLSMAGAFTQGFVYKYSGGTWTETGLGVNTFGYFELAFDTNDNLWCISDRDLYKYEDEWKHKSDLIDLVDRYLFTGLASDKEGGIYISYTFSDITYDNYIYKIDANENIDKIKLPKENLSGRLFPSFITVSEDNSTVYIGTMNFGCFTYTSNQWSKLPIETNTFSSNFMLAFKTETDGIFLKSGNSRDRSQDQIYNYKENQWSELTEAFPFRNAINYDINFSQKNSEELLMRLNDSIYVKSQEGWSLFPFPELIQNVNSANSNVYFDHEGRQWLLHLDRGLIFYNSPSGWKVFEDDEYGLTNTNYFSVFNHPVNNELWISGYQGIAVYNYVTDQWRFLSFDSLGIRNNYLALDIYNDMDIIATTGQSLIRLNEGSDIDTLSTLSGYPELGSFFSSFIEEDTIWLGMHGAVAKYHDGNFDIFSRENSGIINGAINTILRDADGNLWFSGSSGGLAIYNKNGLSNDLINKDIISEVNEIEEPLNFTLFPNPFSTELNINLPVETPSAHINIYNSNGQLTFSSVQQAESIRLALHDLAKGTYYVEIIDPKTKKSGVQKCIKP